DVTPAMIERARALAAEKGLANVAWQVGDVLPLPYPDGAFSLVVSRFAVHHFPEPSAVLAEMKRVCAPGGRVALVDVAASEDPAEAAALNRMEKLRHPSPVRRPALGAAGGLLPGAGARSWSETEASVPHNARERSEMTELARRVLGREVASDRAVRRLSAILCYLGQAGLGVGIFTISFTAAPFPWLGTLKELALVAG